MPNVILHLVLAETVLLDWRKRELEAPFPLNDPAAVNAFRQGALGPDMGYFPGGRRFLSDLAHLFRTGDLTRHLVQSARDANERAFAWGWVSHVLADGLIHPLVGREVGGLLLGDRQAFLNGESTTLAHVGAEIGLDLHFAVRFPSVFETRTAPVFHGPSLHFLAEAYRRTYGWSIEPSILESSHRAVAFLTSAALRLARIRQTLQRSRLSSCREVILRWTVRASRGAGGGLLKGGLLGLVHLFPPFPSRWLVEAVEKTLGSFGDHFFFHFAGNLQDLANLNLETGQRMEPSSRPLSFHPGAWAPAVPVLGATPDPRGERLEASPLPSWGWA